MKGLLGNLVDTFRKIGLGRLLPSTCVGSLRTALGTKVYPIGQITKSH